MSIWESIPKFEFRGSRDYLHSTTVFDWIATFGDPTGIDFTFHHLTGNQCFPVKAVDYRKDQNLVARFKCVEFDLCLVEGIEPIQSSYPCNEADICSMSTYSGDAVSFQFPMSNGATFLECIVANYKKLLMSTSEGKKGKLLFARLRLNYVPKVGRISVQHRRVIGAFFEAQIKVGEEMIGSLYFGQS